jgi:hypothetical protein
MLTDDQRGCILRHNEIDRTLHQLCCEFRHALDRVIAVVEVGHEVAAGDIAEFDKAGGKRPNVGNQARCPLRGKSTDAGDLR